METIGRIYTKDSSQYKHAGANAGATNRATSAKPGAAGA